jgi:hypothetical protein
VNKAELRAAYTATRAPFEAGLMFANEYALKLDELLSGYFGLPPLAAPPEDAD